MAASGVDQCLAEFSATDPDFQFGGSRFEPIDQLRGTDVHADGWRGAHETLAFRFARTIAILCSTSDLAATAVDAKARTVHRGPPAVMEAPTQGRSAIQLGHSIAGIDGMSLSAYMMPLAAASS